MEAEAQALDAIRLDEGAPPGRDVYEAPVPELEQHAARGPTADAVLLRELGHGRDLITGPVLSVFNLLPDLMGYPQVGRLRSTRFGHTDTLTTGQIATQRGIARCAKD